jgi:hypothetical protein
MPAEALLEFHQVGAIVRVTAVDPESLVEVTVQGPAAAGPAALERAAVSKLRYVLAKKQTR